MHGGHVRDARPLRKAGSLPALLAAPKGSFKSALPPIEEGRRDFARIFFSDERKIFLMGRGLPSMRPLHPTPGPSKANIGDLSDQVIERAEELFCESLAQQLAQVFGGPPDESVVAKLRARATAAMTVNVGVDFALHMKLMPMFLQPFFLIVVIPEVNDARVVTYGFVSAQPQDVVGDRPEAKRTPQCVRLLSPNLLRPGDPLAGWQVEYSLRSVSSASITQVVEADLQLVREAIRTASWNPLL
jgi:hypothetical protein